MDPKLKAFLSVGAAYFIWSFLGVIFQTSAFTAFQNIFLFSLLTCLYILLLPGLQRKLSSFNKFTWNRNLLFFALTSGFSALFWFKGLSMLPIAQAILLYASVPLFAFLLELVLLKESFQLKRLGALALGFLGIVIIISQGFSANHSSLLGIVFVLLGAFLNALQGIYNKRIAHSFTPITVVLFIMLSQTIVTAPLAFLRPWHINTYSIFTTLFISIFATLIGYFLFVSGFKILRASTIMIIGYLDPVLASLWGFVFLAQKISIAIFLGGLIILLAGYVIIQLEQKA